MKPLIVLALPRTGTKMLCSALASHPEIDFVSHEFTGDEDDFWKHPYVLSNYLHGWMLDDRIVRVCLYRENAIEGALSLLLMAYLFPDGQFDVPTHEIRRLARFRLDQERAFQEVSDWSVSYESLCVGGDVEVLPDWFCQRFTELVGIEPQSLTTQVRKVNKAQPRNREEIACLRA